MYRSNYADETQIRPWAGKWLGISPTYIHVCVKHAMDLQQRKRKRRTCVCGSNLSHSAYYNHVCTERPGQYSDGSDSDFELEMASNLEDRSFQAYSNDPTYGGSALNMPAGDISEGNYNTVLYIRDCSRNECIY